MCVGVLFCFVYQVCCFKINSDLFSKLLKSPVFIFLNFLYTLSTACWLQVFLHTYKAMVHTEKRHLTGLI